MSHIILTHTSTVIQLLIDDCFGETGRLRNIPAIQAACKEAKTNKSLHTYELICRNLSVGALVLLIQPVILQLNHAVNQNIITQTKLVLKRCVSGLIKNQSIDVQYILIYIYQLINNHTVNHKSIQHNNSNNVLSNSEVKQRLSKQMDDTYTIHMKPSLQRSIQHQNELQNTASGPSTLNKQQKHYNHVVIVYALQLFHALLATNKLTPKLICTDKKMLSMVDQLMILITDMCFNSDKLMVSDNQQVELTISVCNILYYMVYCVYLMIEYKIVTQSECSTKHHNVEPISPLSDHTAIYIPLIHCSTILY